MQPVQDLTLDNTVSRTQYQFTLESADHAALSTWTPKLVAALRKQARAGGCGQQPGRQRACGLRHHRPRQRRALGISVGTVDNALYDAFGQRIVSTIFTQSNQYRVIMEADPESYRSVDSLASIYVPSAGGGQVPLSAIAKVDVQTRPLLINHLAQFPATTVSFNLAAGASLGAAVTAIENAEQAPGPAGQHPHHLPGRGARVSQQPEQRAAAAGRCGARHVHRARACCTKASFTRSRFSRRCPRPASARCSP